jgi:hypothetical protein
MYCTIRIMILLVVSFLKETFTLHCKYYVPFGCDNVSSSFLFFPECSCT